MSEKLKLTKRDQFVLMPFAEVFAGWNTKLETMPDFELWALRRAAKKPGQTNCWWAVYHAANWPCYGRGGGVE